jgi:hypothetical protein
MKPNYTGLGLSECMGPQLREKVEELLSKDLMQYGLNEDRFKFDWSESVIEGKRTTYLDGAVENFSEIYVFNGNDEIAAEGWMEFIHNKNENFFIVFWEYLSIFINGKEVEVKKDSGVPTHILNMLPFSTRKNINEFYY